MQKSDFRKGQEVFLLIIEGSNEFRSLRNAPFEKRILRAQVTSVGSKYITVQIDQWRKVSFAIEDDFRQAYDCCEDYKLFLTEQAVRDYEERRILFRELREAFNYCNEEKYSLDQLRAVRDIVENKK